METFSYFRIMNLRLLAPFWTVKKGLIEYFMIEKAWKRIGTRAFWILPPEDLSGIACKSLPHGFIFLTGSLHRLLYTVSGLDIPRGGIANMGRRMLWLELWGRRLRGRPKGTFMVVVEEDIKLVRARKNDAEDESLSHPRKEQLKAED